MHKIRNEKASAIFQENSTRQINKTKYIIGNLNLLFQMKQKKFLCAISSKAVRGGFKVERGQCYPSFKHALNNISYSAVWKGQVLKGA